jgi:predicted Mrr-cat superfamily restriction endonuclease
MAKKRERSEVEWLRGEVKKLRSAIKHYKKELGRLSKRSLNYEELEAVVQEQELAVEEIKHATTTLNCSKCQSNSVTIADLGAKVYKFCSNCGNREKIK